MSQHWPIFNFFSFALHHIQPFKHDAMLAIIHLTTWTSKPLTSAPFFNKWSKHEQKQQAEHEGAQQDKSSLFELGGTVFAAFSVSSKSGLSPTLVLLSTAVFDICYLLTLGAKILPVSCVSANTWQKGKVNCICLVFLNRSCHAVTTVVKMTDSKLTIVQEK